MGPMPCVVAARWASTHATGAEKSMVSATALTTRRDGSGTKRIGSARSFRISGCGKSGTSAGAGAGSRSFGASAFGVSGFGASAFGFSAGFGAGSGAGAGASAFGFSTTGSGSGAGFSAAGAACSIVVTSSRSGGPSSMRVVNAPVSPLGASPNLMAPGSSSGRSSGALGPDATFGAAADLRPVFERSAVIGREIPAKRGAGFVTGALIAGAAAPALPPASACASALSIF